MSATNCLFCHCSRGFVKLLNGDKPLFLARFNYSFIDEHRECKKIRKEKKYPPCVCHSGCATVTKRSFFFSPRVVFWWKIQCMFFTFLLFILFSPRPHPSQPMFMFLSIF